MRGRKLVKEINMIRIAIDGPGGAGKSSLAKAVAKRLGIIVNPSIPSANIIAFESWSARRTAIIKIAYDIIFSVIY